MMLFVSLSASVIQSMEVEPDGAKLILSQEQMRMSRPKPPKKNLLKKEQLKNQNTETKDVISGSIRTVKYSRPHYPPKPPQEKYIPYSFDTHLDNAGNQKMLGKDEE